MAYLKFLNSSEVYKCKVIPQNNIVTLKFDSDMEVSTAGFDLYLDEACETDIGVGFYHDFTTIYRNDEETEKYNGYQLSNDGSVYSGETVTPEPEPYEPTLEELKSSKRLEVSNVCQQTIFNGIDVQLSSGETKHYSLKTEDQINLIGKQVQLATDATQFEYHADVEPCEWYSREDMQKIVDTAFQFVSFNTTYCNSFYKYINSLSDKSQIQSLVYGIEIPEQYQSPVYKDYLSKMKA